MRRSRDRSPPPLGRMLGIALSLLVSGCLPELGPNVRELRDVREVEGSRYPGDEEFEAGTPRTLPHIWKNADRQRATSAWYRSTFALEEAPDRPWAVYLPRFAQSAEVVVNGRWIGSTGRVDPPLTRNWNRPVLLSIPRHTLHAGENALDLRLAVQKTAPAYLRSVFIGPEREMLATYRLREFLQVTCARYGALWLAAIALILGFISIRRVEFRPFRFFATGCVLWAIASAELFVEDPPLDGRAWQLVAMAFAAASIVLFVQTTHRSFAKRRPAIEIALYLLLALIVGVLAVVPDRLFEATSLLLWAFCAGTGTYLGLLFMFGDRPPLPRQRALAVLGFAAVLIGLHDVLLALWIPVPPTFFLAPLLTLVAAFWGAWVVIDHFLGALREAETLNRELEHRVAIKHAELEENFERLRELERHRVVSTERERLMREMHDGMGGQLVSALAMAEDGETSAKQIADVLRAALDDMRLVIDSLDPVIDDIPTLLGMIRGRIEPRLRAHGLRFDWRVTDLPPTPQFGPEQFLHVLRIAQEAITNTVKHADARVIRVETAEQAGSDGRPGIRVSIGDDGRGLHATATHPGRGLDNMRVRAARLSGSIEVSGRAGEGTVVDLWIPMEPSGEAPPPQ